MRITILKDMDKLQRDKNGYYDNDLDMYFDDLEQWLLFKYNKKWSDII